MRSWCVQILWGHLQLTAVFMMELTMGLNKPCNFKNDLMTIEEYNLKQKSERGWKEIEARRMQESSNRRKKKMKSTIRASKFYITYYIFLPLILIIIFVELVNLPLSILGLGWEGKNILYLIVFIVTIVIMSLVHEYFNKMSSEKESIDAEFNSDYSFMTDNLQDPEEFRKDIRMIAVRFSNKLATTRLQALSHDKYGTLKKDGWYNEITYFISSAIGKGESLPEFYYSSSVYNIIDEVALEKQKELANREFTFSNTLTGHQYEQFCARILEKAGWLVTVTKGSGDYGVDLIAEKETRRIAIQCKKYSKPVPNKAVQEIIAGASMYYANEMVVVSNTEYTKAAMILAEQHGVILLHHDVLNNL